jgi:hypothetical protein
VKDAAEPVDVTALIAEVRNPDLPDRERVDAARLLIVGCAVRSLAGLMVMVRDGRDLSPGAADAALDGWALVHPRQGAAA